MKVKKIILSMVSTLILMAVFISQNVFAVEPINETYRELNKTTSSINSSNPQYALARNNYAIPQFAAGSSTGRIHNMYCALAQVGFSHRGTDASYLSDTYTNKYNMLLSVDKTSILNSGLYNTKIDNVYVYDYVLAAADLFYLGNSSDEFESYIKPLVNAGKLKYGMDTYDDLKEDGKLITPNQVRAVQQAVLWHFTNYGSDLDFYNLIKDNTNTSSIDFLFYTTSNTTNFSSLHTDDDNVVGEAQNNQAKQLYIYMINQAATNAKNTNYKNVNKVTLYTNGNTATNTTDKTKTQPLILIEKGAQVFDLALRKYITKVGTTNITNRVPNPVKTKLDNGTATTAEYKHRKNPVTVTEGAKVTYTLTVYNEGDVAGKATEIVDKLPAGLTFDKTSTESISANSNYSFAYNTATNEVTITDKRANTVGNLNEYNGELNSASVQVVCTVTATADTDNNKILTNVAWISKAYNASKGEVYSGTEVGFDRDSAPGTHPNQSTNLVSNNENAYKGKSSNQNVSPAQDIHYEGEQDDDDFEKIVLAPKKMDLALRKFITKIGTQNITNREPVISGNTVAEQSTTAEKSHPKDKLEVVKGDTVEYTIRIYNEGEVDGYATEVTDYLPEGLTLKTGSTTNTTYGWSSTDGKTIKTNYLSKTNGRLIQAANRDYSKFNSSDASGKYYWDLKVECVVNNNATSDNLKNIAEITDAEDKNGNKKDTDSTPGNVNKNSYNPKNPTKGLGEEDDDDFEDLKLAKMDLALRKFITKIGTQNITNRVPVISGNAVTVIEPNQDPTHIGGVYVQDTTAEKSHPKDKLDVSKGETVVYTIRVYNEGKVDGYAKEVTDYLPEGLTLKSDSTINSTYGWTSTDGKTITTSYLADKILTAANRNYSNFNASDAAGKYYRDLEIECIVNDKATSSNLKNIAEITDSEDKNGNKEDEDSQTNNVNKNDYNPKNPTKGLGEQDDDDFEDLKLVEFDLALRKYITKVEDKDGNIIKSNDDLAGRNPNKDNKIDTSKIPDTADYKHRKDPVVVKPGYFVYYNLTVYNEGDIDGYASKITDQLPAGVRFVEIVDADNSKYEVEKPDYYYSNGGEIESGDGILILKRKENQGVISAYNGTTLNSETVTIKCKVTADAKTGADKIYTNIAWISEDYNEKGVADRDSKPTEYPNENKLVTDYPDNGYINKKDNDGKDLKDSNQYFKGEQDDDDFEKIIIYKEPEIHKGVKDVKNQDSGYDEDVTTPHVWVINSSLPLDIADYKKYTIIDDIDYRLVYGKVSEVNIIDKTGNKLATLEENTDYTLQYTQNTSTENSAILGNKYSGTLKLTFIDEGKTVSDKLKANAGNIIEVKFTTTFAKDENGKLLAEIIGKEIPNKAKLEYKNTSDGESETEKPEVHTGGITLYKYKTSDGKKVALEGAEFEIFRNKTDAEKRADEVKEGKETSSVKALQTAKSDEKGLVSFVGLEYGEDAMDDEKNKQADGTYDHDSNKTSTTYWIVETVAPKGYATITTPIEVKINNDSYKDDVEVLVKEEESKESSNRLVENKPLEFDLALRKFITKVDDKNVTTRVPQVKYKDGKITYEHTKEPVNVVNGKVVTYTLRIFNEGQVNGYASVITDDIPEGLVFLPEHDTNKEYRWVMYAELPEGTEVEDESKVVECKVKGTDKVKKYVETTDASKAVIIRTDYLSKEQGEARMKEGDTENPNLLKAFNPDSEVSDKNPDYRDVKLAFRVTERNGSKRILINYAQISDDQDEDGNKVDDIDSKTDEWNDGEDDQDIEKLKVPLFDLALRKWVTQAIVTENGKTTVTKTGHQPWDDPEGIVKVELHRKKLSNVTVKFKYSIRVYNQGEIAGYAKEVKDYIPEGLKFVAKDNPDWKYEGNNIITTTKLANTLLKPGEYADVEVILTWINGKNNLGLKTNIAEISKDYNEEGVPDKDSTPNNKKPEEDDIDDAPVMLSIKTGKEVTYIVLGTTILAILAGGIFLIKKYVL